MKTSVTRENIKQIMSNSEYKVFTGIFDKQTIVVAKLPNGFIVMGESACVDPKNYDEEMGERIAMRQIEDKIWELEGYLLQSKMCSQEQGLNDALDIVKKAILNGSIK